MRTDAPYLHARFKNIERQDKPWTARQLSEMEALNNILFGDPYSWITPSMFDPEAERLRNAYPAAGTTRIKWYMDSKTTRQVSLDMRASDFEIGYTKNDHLFYGYGGRDSDLLVRKPTTRKLKVGGTYKTQDGKSVAIVEARHTPGYECVLGDDDIWRYNREGDRGRVTGTAHDFSDPRNLIPEPSTHEYMLTVDKAIKKGMKTGRMSGRGAGMGQMPRSGGKMIDMLKQSPTKEEAERQAQAWRDAYPHARLIGDEIDLTSTPVTLSPEGEAAPMTELPQWVEGLPLLSGYRGERYDKEDTLAEEIKADVERAAELAAKTPPGFMQYEEAKKQGLVDEDPWPTTEEILAAHAAKHYADGLREDAERDLARIEARNAFKVALRKSAITASLIMIGGVAACFAVGLIGALVYTAFNYFAPRMEGSDTAATAGFYLILTLFGLMVGLLVGTSNRR